MNKYQKMELKYQGIIIHRQGSGLVSLTDMWRASGAVLSKETDRWLNLEDTVELILQLVLEATPDLKTFIDKLWETKLTINSKKAYRNWTRQVKQLAIDTNLLFTKRGGSCGTYAIDKIAIAYAKSLSAEFHSWVLTAIKERIEEEADPELGISRSRQQAIRSWKKPGKSLEYIGARIYSIPREEYYEEALSQHGVSNPKNFATCKFRLYLPIIGDTKKFRIARGLKKGQNCKDGMHI